MSGSIGPSKCQGIACTESLLPTRDDANLLYFRVLSASIGGTVTSFVVTPLDVVKARLQAQGTHLTRPNIPHFNNTLDAFAKIAKAEGIGSLWRGIGASLIVTVPGTALYFTVYENIKDSLEGSSFSPESKAMIAGVSSRCTTVIVTNPIELIRTFMQSNSKDVVTSQNIGLQVKKMVSEGGIRKLWGGLMPTLWRDVPFSAIYWATLETFRIRVNRQIQRMGYENNRSSRFFVDLIGGACSGSLSAFFTNPIDVIKTRRQMSLSISAEKQSMIAITKEVYSQEGLKGFSRGLLPRMIKVAPACAIMISSYELCKSLLSSR
eukprot:TRINITY_DN13996_c0_g1_i1.p1 TRINITY_DN13996_c0_g1~~TRINITY_DN13996_c0_g1_i1.p1  ORF type:complete len:367 (+),score=82.58 TRINITY_DN13996_c0_g1_i1:139-1101(+)